MKYSISVVILFRNKVDGVIDAYNDLMNQSYQDFNIVLLNDNSKETEVQKLNNIIGDKVRIYDCPFDGFDVDGKAMYIIKKALKDKPRYIYNMHNDMRINDKDLLLELFNFMENNSKCGAVAPTIYNGQGKMTWGPGIVKIRMGREYNINETFMIRSKCYFEMGFYPKKLHYYGGEYFTFNWLTDNGYSTDILENASITHYSGTDKNTSIQFQNHKDYYRPRTSILIMKLFCKEDTFKRKLRYFYEELGEPRMKMKKFIKNFQFISLIRTMFLLFIGTIAGLVIPIKLNKPYKIEESN